MKRLALIILTVLAAFTALGEIRITQTEFSLDDGKTWQLDPPVVKASKAQIKVRVSYAGSDIRKLDNGGYISNCLASERDWPGSKHCMKGCDGKPPKSWHYLPHAPRPFEYSLDLRGWGPGYYRFEIRLSYWLDAKTYKERNPQRDGTQVRETFNLLIVD